MVQLKLAIVNKTKTMTMHAYNRDMMHAISLHVINFGGGMQPWRCGRGVLFSWGGYAPRFT